MPDKEYVVDPTPLEQLAQAYAEKKTGSGIIFFIGSGPSTDAGLPDLQALRGRLTQYAEKLVKTNAISNELRGADLRALKAETDYWKSFSLIKFVSESEMILFNSSASTELP